MKAPMHLWWLLILGLGACQRPRAPAPELAAYSAFAEALRRGDSHAAFADLSAASQRQLEARAKAVSEASQGVVKDDAASMLFQPGFRPETSEETRLVESDGQRAVIEVRAEGGSHRVVMVREGSRWVVDLADIF